MDTALQADDLDAWAAADERFHAQLVELAGNRQLEATVLNLLGPGPPRPHVHAAAAAQARQLHPRAPADWWSAARRRRRGRCCA
jgi:DNA-binding GntR family transcriptional regulator